MKKKNVDIYVYIFVDISDFNECKIDGIKRKFVIEFKLSF